MPFQFYYYLGERVEVAIKHKRPKRRRVCFGTFLAIDKFSNLLLRDSYFVVLHKEQRQRIDMGLMLIRGQSVVTIDLATDEKELPIWPTEPIKQVKTKKKKVLDTKPEVPPPTIKVKPVKLKRSWLTEPGSSSKDLSPKPAPLSQALLEESLLKEEELLLGSPGDNIPSVNPASPRSDMSTS